MKLLISGATGFIGKNLIKKLLEEEYILHIITRPSTDKTLFNKKVSVYTFDNDVNNLVSFMEKEKFDGVIHLASLFIAQHKTENVYDLVSSNVLFSTCLLEATTKSNTPWFINTGTFTQHYKNKKYSPTNLYSATKQAFESIAQYYIETSKTSFVTIKLFDTFGPNDTRPKIFNLWLNNLKNKEVLDMSPGEQIIDINYIDNIIDGYLKVISLLSKDKKREFNGKAFFLMSKKRMSLKKLATLFEKINGKKLNINWGGRDYRPREIMTPFEKGTTIPSFKPKVTLEEGIRRIIKN